MDRGEVIVPQTGGSEERLVIHGKWDECDKEPWEWFTVQLHGEEAGDVMTDWREIKRVLADAGYELVRARGKQEKV